METISHGKQLIGNDMETPLQNQGLPGNHRETDRKPSVSTPTKLSTSRKPPPSAFIEESPSTCGELPDFESLEPEATDAELAAHVVTSSEMLSAATIHSSLPVAQQTDLGAILLNLQTHAASVAGGSLESAESMAIMQAKTLELVFHDLLSSAYANRKSLRFDYLLRLAFRAQAQSSRTLETLAALKKPSVFAQQLNMAEQQVVNNQSPKRTSRSTRARTTSKPKTVRLARKAKSSRRKDAS